MPSAQQKPKSNDKRGQRNGDRRNGKSWSKGYHKTNNGWLSGREGKKRKGFYGVSLKTIRVRAAAMGITESAYILQLKEKHNKAVEYKRSLPPNLRHELARSIEIKHLRQRIYGNSTGTAVGVDTKAASGKLSGK